MEKVTIWFKNLSRIAQVSVLSSVALGGLFIASAMSPAPEAAPAMDSTVIQSDTKKEPVITSKVETDTQEIAFEKVTKETSSLSKGETQVEIVGIKGIKTLTHTLTLTDGIETDRQTSEVITSTPVSEVTLVGTYIAPASNCDSNYSGCVPDVSYDLDCADIGYSLEVHGYDRHGFDRDNDGYGCESY